MKPRLCSSRLQARGHENQPFLLSYIQRWHTTVLEVAPYVNMHSDLNEKQEEIYAFLQLKLTMLISIQRSAKTTMISCLI